VIDPLLQGSERFGTQPVNANPGIGLGLVVQHFDQAAPAEYAEMPAHRRPTHAATPRQLAGGQRIGGKQMDHLPARWVGQGKKNRLDLINHNVNCYQYGYILSSRDAI
jgi:hypothetical protein